MNKTELITAVAEKTGMSKKDADSAVNAVLEYDYRSGCLRGESADCRLWHI